VAGQQRHLGDPRAHRPCAEDGDYLHGTSVQPVTNSLVGKHRPTLEQALRAIRERAYWSAFPESPSPKGYGESAADDARGQGVSRGSSATRIGAQTTTGGVVVGVDSSAIATSSAASTKTAGSPPGSPPTSDPRDTP